MVTVHLEGMGWFGSFLARRLHDRDVAFTWHDTDDEVCAWQASTGCVYPAGDDLSTVNLDRWLDLADGLMAPWSEVVPFLVQHKHPLDGRGFDADLGPLRRMTTRAVMVDVPTFVTATRADFAAVRLDGPPGSTPDRYVVAHGFGRRLRRYSWGWNVDAYVTGAEHATVYGKPHRFAIRYLHWQPTRGLHLAGSTLVSQARPKRLDIGKHLTSYLSDVAGWGPTVAVDAIGEAREGWRPVGGGHDDVEVAVSSDGRRLEVPSVPYSGVRWAPTITDPIVEACS